MSLVRDGRTVDRQLEVLTVSFRATTSPVREPPSRAAAGGQRAKILVETHLIHQGQLEPVEILW